MPDYPTDQRLSELVVGWWLEIKCGCKRTTYYPFRLMSSQIPAHTTLGEVLPRLRCKGCRSVPATLALVDDPSRGETGKGGGQPWVRVALRGG